MAHGQAALVVAAADALLGLEQRLVRLVGGDLLERRPRLEPAAGGGWLVAAQRHRLDPLEEFDLLAAGQGHDGLLPGRASSPATRPRLRLRDFSLALVVEHVDVDHVDLEELLDRLP